MYRSHLNWNPTLRNSALDDSLLSSHEVVVKEESEKIEEVNDQSAPKQNAEDQHAPDEDLKL